MLINKFRFFYEWLRYFSIVFSIYLTFPKWHKQKKVEFWTWITLLLSHSYVYPANLMLTNCLFDGQTEMLKMAIDAISFWMVNYLTDWFDNYS